MASSTGGSQSAVVLIIDPEPLNQREMRGKLMRLGYVARSTDDYTSAVAIVEATPPDVVLLTGTAKQDQSWNDLQVHLNNWGIPVLRLAGTTANNLAAMSDADLRLKVETALRTRNTNEALIIENTRLAAERLYDPLTGLFNRRYIMIRTEEEIKRSSRHSYPLSCLILDIDSFDTINDNWGHNAGDAILRDMAHVMTRTLRATDIIARYRDDEFIALLTDTDAAGAQIAANRLRDAVTGHDFYNPASEEPVRLTASLGVAYWQPASRPGEGTWEPQLIALAERALKAAKLSGSNRLVMLQAA